MWNRKQYKAKKITRMANLSFSRNGYHENLDFMLAPHFRISLIIACGVVTFINGVSFLALNRTRHMPQTAKFLSSALLVFDLASVAIFGVRKLIEDVQYNLVLQYLAMGFNFLAYVNIAIMSVERLIVFHWPNFYLRTVTFSAFKRVCIVVWILYKISWLVDVGLCYVFVDDVDPETQLCFTLVIERHVKIIYWTSTFISCICLAKISFIIAKQSRKNADKKGKNWQNNKSTIVVSICIVNYLFTTASSAIMTFSISEAYIRRAAHDVVMIINSLVDISAYVLWFKECRMELFKMLGKVFPVFMKKAERLRVEVFDIVTFSNKNIQEHNRK